MLLAARRLTRRRPAWLCDEGGQAAVELVALLPLCATFGLAIGHVLAAEATRELAGHAVEAAAIAVGSGSDPAAAARAALPEWSRDRVTVRVDGREVRVRLEPPAVVPALANALASTAVADAGPEAPEPEAPSPAAAVAAAQRKLARAAAPSPEAPSPRATVAAAQPKLARAAAPSPEAPSPRATVAAAQPKLARAAAPLPATSDSAATGLQAEGDAPRRRAGGGGGAG